MVEIEKMFNILIIILYSLLKLDKGGKNMGAKLNLIIAIFILALVIASPLIVEIIGKAKAEPIMTTNTIRIGTVDVDAVKQIIKFQPTADYIAAKLSNNQTTHYNGKVIITPTINDMINLLKEQKIDLYFESPFTIALVDKESGAVPFLLRWKEGVAQYHSIFIVKKNSPINTINDFVGKTIAFEAPESTSGYLLPKAYLVQKGFSLSGEATESYLTQGRAGGVLSGGSNITNSSIDESIGNSNSNNNTIRYVFAREDQNIPLWIVEGKADIGVISNVDIEQETYESVKSQLKIVDRTIDVPRHVVSHRSELDPVLVEKIKHMLVNMDKDQEGIKILKNFEETTKYEEIKNRDETFKVINDMLKALEQKEGEWSSPP
jgi:phosphonate transport system substrate-binding protein